MYCCEIFQNIVYIILCRMACTGKSFAYTCYMCNLIYTCADFLTLYVFFVFHAIVRTYKPRGQQSECVVVFFVQQQIYGLHWGILNGENFQSVQQRGTSLFASTAITMQFWGRRDTFGLLEKVNGVIRDISNVKMS